MPLGRRGDGGTDTARDGDAHRPRSHRDRALHADPVALPDPGPRDRRALRRALRLDRQRRPGRERRLVGRRGRRGGHQHGRHPPVLPDGRVRAPELRVRDVRNVGLASLPRDDAVIRPAVPRDDFREAFIDFRDVSDVLLEGITFDYTEPGYGGSLRLVTHGNFIARDLRTKGKLPDTDKSRKHVAYRFDVQDEEGIGLVERIVARDGGHDGGNGVGIFVGKDHAGTVTFRDCEVANFPNNGLYASAPGADYDGYRGANGAVHVRGGRYENNNIANIRIGSTGSTVRHATVVVDKVPPTISESDLNVRGIRLRARNGQVVEDCDIRIGEDAGEGFGAISYHPDHGSSTIKNTRIQVDRDDFSAIDATHANGGGTEAPSRSRT
ncbi:hypothetical protein ACFQL4_11525 [Halosimplex aquaticum]